MIYLKNERELVKKIKDDIKKTSKKNIKFFIGHLPLMYINKDPKKRKVMLGADRWGIFSWYTFDLGCRILDYAQKQGKKVSIIFVVDDDIELPLVSNTKKLVHQDKTWKRKLRRKLFKTQQLPPTYKKSLLRYKLSKKLFLTQKRSWGQSILISEKILKRDAKAKNFVAKNECSLAYKEIILDKVFFNLKEDYLVGFIPGQCKGNLCEGILNLRKDLNSTHIFFPHIELMGSLLGSEKGYEKIGKIATLKEIYNSKQVLYKNNQ